MYIVYVVDWKMSWSWFSTFSNRLNEVLTDVEWACGCAWVTLSEIMCLSLFVFINVWLNIFFRKYAWLYILGIVSTDKLFEVDTVIDYTCPFAI